MNLWNPSLPVLWGLQGIGEGARISLGTAIPWDGTTIVDRACPGGNQMSRVTDRLRKFAVAVLVVAGSYSAATADPVAFTWDPSKSVPALAVPDSSFTADTVDSTTYLHSVNQAN